MFIHKPNCPIKHPQLPETGFARLPEVLRYIPVSRSCLFEMVNRGEFARPVKLTARVTAWRVEDIRAFIASRLTATAANPNKSASSNLSDSGILTMGDL